MFFGEIEIKANIGFKPTACLLRLDSISLDDIEEERNIDPESGKYLFHILYYGRKEDIINYMKISDQPHDKNQLKELYEKIESKIKNGDRNVVVDYILSKCTVFKINNIKFEISANLSYYVYWNYCLNIYVLVPDKDELLSIIDRPRGD